MKKLITVITVSFNAELCIEDTLKSMKNQGKGDWEYLVIDGNSSDSTNQLIKSYYNIIDTLIIESDEGIYDAMNKGLSLAKGKYVYFLNAGDSFYSPNVLRELALVGQSTHESILFGDLKTSIKHLETQQLVNSRFKGIPHQACFFARENINTFDLNYQVCADFKQYLQLKIRPGFSAKHVPFIIANYDSIKLDKSKSQRLKYDILRSKEKLKISFECLKGVNKILGVGFYFIHLIKYHLGFSKRENISEN